MRRKADPSANLRLRGVREELGWSREKMAERIDLSVDFLAQIEMGKKSLSVRTMRRVCERLSISADYLLLGRKKKGNTEEIARLLATLKPPYRQMAEQLLKNLILAICRAQDKRRCADDWVKISAAYQKGAVERMGPLHSADSREAAFVDKKRAAQYTQKSMIRHSHVKKCE